MSKETKAGATGPENPYIAARREWNERYGDYISEARTWKVVAMAALGIALVAVGGVVWIGAQSKVIPYVVEVDKLGEPVAVNPAMQAAPVDPRVIEAELARWVFDMRTIDADATAERHYINDGYALIASNSAAYQAMNDHFAASDPFKEATNQTVQVQVESVLPLSANTWRIEWEEVATGRNGELAYDQEWQADVTIAIHPPSDAAGIMANPMGIYVTDFSWTKRL